MSCHRRQQRIALSTLSIALFAALAAGPVAAQETAKDKEKDKKEENVKELERIQVTGSNIRRVDAETASPVQVVTAKDIENMGLTTPGACTRPLS